MPAPLLARWLSWSLGDARAGASTVVHVEIENAGAVTWGDDVAASYHWLDERGNAIVWDGLRTPLPGPVAPGGRVTLAVGVRAPIPPGRYRLALDLVAEHRAWFSEIGDAGPSAPVTVGPRVIAERLRDVAEHHVAPGVTVPGDWERRALALHAEGFAVVAGAVEAGSRRLRGELAAWAPGPGRVPAFAHPLLCPSVLHGIALERLPEVAGLPAFAPPADEPWVYDASLVLRVNGD